MIGRILVLIFALALGAAMPLGAAAGETEDTMLKRDDEMSASVDDGGGDDNDGDTHTGTNTGTNSGFTSGVNSNDNTNSKHTAVSKDKDRSSGDLTKDKTNDGPGGKKRDWSENKTNDNTKRDTR